MEGRTVSRYQIHERLGAGGMGVVYRAVDTQLGRTVALKFLPVHLSEQEEDKQRFIQEARAASALDHPNLCPVYDIGTSAEGEIFIAMPCYDGQTLKERLRQGPLGANEALDVLIQMAEGIREAHANGIVHRDLKPGNVILTRDGKVKIVDFGLAKLIGDPTVTRSGAAVGTVAYMSPEQARGEAPDRRADIWSLGVVLYECLTGQLPFQGNSIPGMLEAIRSADFTPASRAASTPPPIDAVLERCLAKRPEKRYPSAAALLADLRGVRAELGLTPAESMTVPLPPARRRKRLLPWAALAVALLVVALAFALLDLSRRPAAAAGQTVAVLPFANQTGETDLDYLGTGLSTALISRLSELSGVDVLSRAQVLHSGEQEGDRESLVSAFGVATFVEGDVHGSPEDLRVQLRISDGETGTVLWSHSVTGRVDRLLGLQEELAQSVARVVSLPMSLNERRRLAREPTGSGRAYESYLRGLAMSDRAWVDPGLLSVANELLTQAVEVDAGFVQAWVALAGSRLRRFRATGNSQYLDSATAAAERAVELDSRLPAARLVMAEVLMAQGRLEDAEAQIASTLASLPNPSRAYEVLASIHYMQELFEQALSLQRAAAELAPEDWTVWNRLGALLGRLSQYDEAANAFGRAAELAPSDIVSPRGMQAAMLLAQGRIDDALSAFEAIPRPIRTPDLASNIGTAYYHSDRPDGLQQAVKHQELAVSLAPTQHIYRRNLADLYMVSGEDDSARREYQAAYDLIRDQAEVAPHDPELKARLSRYAAGAERCEEAIQAADEVRALNPRLGRAFQMIALAYARCGSREEALASVERAIALGESPVLLAERVEFSSLRDDPEFIRLTQSTRR